MKRITLLTNNLDVGGSQIVLINIVNEALLNNYHVDVISLTNNLFLQDRISKCDRVKIYTCTNKKNSTGLLNRLKITFNFFKFFFKERTTLLHSHFWQIDITYLLILTFFSKIKIIHTIHSPGSSYLRKKPIDYFNNFIEKKFINRDNVTVTVVSKEIELVIRNVLNYKKKCAIIPNGIKIVDKQTIKMLPPSFIKQKDFIYFVYPARYQESKGHILLLKAFKKLLNEVPNIILILIGINLKENLQNQATSLNIDKNILFLNPIDDINKVLVHSDFGVFPSFYEGHSIALCEMMAIGLPIVASDISGNRQVTKDGDAALLYKSGSEEELFQSMLRLLKDPYLADELSKRGQKIVAEQYSLEHFFLKYEEIYNKSLN